MYENPFNSQIAKEYSNYSKFVDNKLILLEKNIPPPILNQHIHELFRAKILSPQFPCVAARSALNTNTYGFAVYPEMCHSESTEGLCRDLITFIEDRKTMNSNFTTFVAVFEKPHVINEKMFDLLLWKQLQLISDSSYRFYEWDKSVSDDPEDSNYSFSFGGVSFFIVSFHPADSRVARKFTWPTLIFNAHSQFELLREQNKIESFKKTIRKRDMDLQGSINQNLTDFGDDSEAKQYSSLRKNNSWKCPFKSPYKLN